MRHTTKFLEAMIENPDGAMEDIAKSVEMTRPTAYDRIYINYTLPLQTYDEPSGRDLNAATEIAEPLPILEFLRL
jgi:hypothetical protein